MKGLLHRNWRALALALLLFLLPAVAYAVDVELSTGSARVQAGVAVEGVITVTGENMSIAQGTYTYDPAILAYQESEGGAGDGTLNLISLEKGGADTLSARILFTATGAGEVQIAANIQTVLDYDGDEQEGGEASLAITVAAPTPTPTPTPLNYAQEGVLAQNVQGVEGELYIWRTLENVTIPSRYSETTLEYHGETVAAAQVTDSDAPTLLYLSNAAGDEGGYYIYDAERDLLYPYQTISSVSKSYIILEPDGSVALPEGFTETTLMIDEREYKAWVSQDAQGEIYLLYARNPDGEVGYYVYNVADESLQRYAVMPARPISPTLPPEVEATPAPEAPEATPAPVESELALRGWQVYAAAGLVALLLLIIVILVVSHAVEKKRRRRRAAQRRAERRKKEREMRAQSQDSSLKQ